MFEKHGPGCYGRGCGVAVLLRNNFNARRCDHFVAKLFESIIELLITTFSCVIHWVVIYRIPPSKAN